MIGSVSLRPIPLETGARGFMKTFMLKEFLPRTIRLLRDWGHFRDDPIR